MHEYIGALQEELKDRDSRIQNIEYQMSKDA